MNLPRRDALLLGLEWVRFACTLPVLLWHYQHFFYVAGHPQGFDSAAQPGYAWLHVLYDHGYLSVQAFWCASGYIFFWKYADGIASGVVSWSRFAWLRLSRLYPLHLLTLLVVAVLGVFYQQRMGAGFVYQHQDWPHFVGQLFMASDWDGRSQWSFNGPIWSISLELLVYALFFVLSLVGWRQWWAVVCIMVGAALVYQLKWSTHPVFLCLFFFYLGGLTCQFQQWHDARCPSAWRSPWLALCWLGVVAAAAMCWAGVLRPMMWVAVFVPVLIISMVRWVQPQSPGGIKLAHDLGSLTYATYLWHFPLQLAAAVYFMDDPAKLPAQQTWWLLLYLGATYTLAHVSYRWFEAPAQAWLRARGPGQAR